jgi:hypothetical protein
MTHPEIERDKDLAELEWFVRRLRGHQARAEARGEPAMARKIETAVAALVEVAAPPPKKTGWHRERFVAPKRSRGVQ